MAQGRNTWRYERPRVQDYGTVLQMTAAQGLFGSEDGGSKMLPNHHNPSAPAPP